MNWTTEQILALAPDAASAKAGSKLASQTRWSTLGHCEHAAWGECKGSAATPYQVVIDLREPAFSCTCPSRKFPCKHGLALLLLFAAQHDSFAQIEPAGWAATWLAKRDARAKTPEKAEEHEDSRAKREAAQARRAAKRQERVLAGIEELELWLCDLVRGGLAAVQTRPASFWEGMAARLVDAQAPGLARQVQMLGEIPTSHPTWADRLLERLGQLALLLDAYRRLDVLPVEHQHDLKALIGWTQEQDELPSDEAVVDSWLVVGQRYEETANLLIERTWLLGETSGRAALILQFSPAHKPVRGPYLCGTAIPGAASFYRGAYPLRAVLHPSGAPQAARQAAQGYPTISGLLEAQADALARNPWLDRFPALLDQVTPAGSDARWFLRDGEGDCLPLQLAPGRQWRLLAISGGAPIKVFSEWDGAVLAPLSAWSNGRWITL